MKLISDIINELVDSERSICSPLLKTKVLATRLKNHELLTWTENELSGYTDIDNLPEYRITSAQVSGTFRYSGLQYNDQPIPTSGLPKEIAEIVLTIDFAQSVKTIEALVATPNKNSSHVEVRFPSELTAILERNMRRMGNPYLQLFSAKKSVPDSAVHQMLSVIRSKLLDFMLKLDEEFGNITEIEELKSKNQRITKIMNTTINNTTGDGNVVNSGDNAKIKAKIKIIKNDKQSLKDALKDQQVAEDDINKLITVIDSEQPDKHKGIFGKQVNAWIQMMMAKALEGSWQIGTGAAGGLLVEAVKAYYGM